MNIRTCPHCDYQYSISEYVKKDLFKVVFSEWDCKNCNKRITFDFNRRVIVALCFGALYLILSLFLTLLKNEIKMTPLMWIGLLVIYILGSIFIFTFDTFKKTN
jgi:CXXC-20-CXXC protein